MKFISYKLYSGLIVLMLLFTSANLTAQNQDRMMDMEKREEIKSDAQDAMKAFKNVNPNLESELQNAAGYAVFPNVGKGAWVLGGAAGNGVVYEKGRVTGYAELRQIDVGFQFGGKAFRELIVFKTQDALNRFKEGNFEFGGSASAVIWDKGRGEALSFENGAGVAIMPKAGAMAGISVGGQEFDYRPVNK